MTENDDSSGQVVHKSRESYGDSFNEHLLEQYKTVRGRIADIIQDRNTQNRFLLTVVTALLAVPVFFLRDQFATGSLALPQGIILLAFPVVGAVISWHWIQWNKTFGQAIGAAYRLMKEMEAHLPAQPFTVENRYRDEEAGGSHKKTTTFTVLMARIFFFGNAIVFIGVVLGVACGFRPAS